MRRLPQTQRDGGWCTDPDKQARPCFVQTIHRTSFAATGARRWLVQRWPVLVAVAAGAVAVGTAAGAVAVGAAAGAAAALARRWLGAAWLVRRQLARRRRWARHSIGWCGRAVLGAAAAGVAASAAAAGEGGELCGAANGSQQSVEVDRQFDLHAELLISMAEMACRTDRQTDRHSPKSGPPLVLK